MCGIVGSINLSLDEKTLTYIAHRGPDAHAMVTVPVGNNQIFLGQTRLAILDLTEAGSQPMFSQCGNYAIVFNGEIYNHLELRQRLSGVSFRGHSDTETILYYIAERGIEAIKDFNGIFAFGFLDIKKGKLYLVRDHFGVKPLYYWFSGHKILFGSELKTISYHPAYQSIKATNLNALDTFLTFRYNPSPQTLFEGIHKLPAAHYIDIDIESHRHQFCNYWPFVPQHIKLSESEAIEQYQFLVERAVRRQLLSDVPIGLFLSGGIDSAALGYLMQKHATYKIKTFTLGFEEAGAFNELTEARKTAKFIDSDHYEVLISQNDYVDFLNKSYYYTEEPIAEPTIPALYYVSNLASKHVKVVLSGQGADEPWGGYKRYIGEKLLTDYSLLANIIPWNLLLGIFPRNESIRRASHAAEATGDLDRFVNIYSIFTPEQKQLLFKKELYHHIKNEHFGIIKQLYDRVADWDNSLSKMLYIDTRTMLPDNLLLFNDKITMSKSIENRVPYLDIDLVEFVESLPISYKINNFQQKYLHKKAMSKWIPQEILNRKKKGFLTPVDNWFQGNLNNIMEEIITSSDSACNQYFEKDYLRRLFKEHHLKKANYSRHLFSLVSFELWYKHFFKSVPVSEEVV